MADHTQNSNFKHIIRVANVDLPGEKKIRFALTKIRGVGIQFADGVCMAAGIDKNTITGNLADNEIKTLNSVVTNPMQGGIPAWMFNRKRDYETGEDKHITGGNLHFVQDNDLKRLKKIKTLRGVRHIKGLTVRGQRTRSNFRKNKGKVVGVSKKKVAPAAAKEGAKKEKK
ncbi:MAG: 30S ribosomal protein S13 [Nanoarchaeota archaeon]|nr:30S ribosomal protein S13 [Nanoarchaeota archaeon]